ncbi:MAG: HEAT repeat domain-containing protein [Gammaproteobacteria bacterium]|nr:HEAT repeat domain-containing protein [Gammaproteobacteria bacterium]
MSKVQSLIRRQEALGRFADKPAGELAIAPLLSLLKADDAWRSAALALSRFANKPAGERAVAFLVSLLKDKNISVRNNAVYVLGRFAGKAGVEQAVPFLIKLLAQETAKGVRWHAAFALAQTDSARMLTVFFKDAPLAVWNPGLLPSSPVLTRQARAWNCSPIPRHPSARAPRAA